MNTRHGSRQGMMLYLLSMVLVVMGLFISIIHFVRGRDQHVSLWKKEKAQAQFLARGAQQHFLLKLKYMGSEMYEAVGFAVGKNPYYDFGAYIRGPGMANPGPWDPKANPGKSVVLPVAPLDTGPLFFTGGSLTTDQMNGLDDFVDPFNDPKAPTGAKIMVVDRSKESINPNDAVGIYSNAAFPPNCVTGGTNKQVMGFPLEVFLADISTDYPPDSVVPNGSIIRVSSLAAYGDHAAIGKKTQHVGTVNWRDPMTGSYSIEEFHILSMGGGGSRSGKKFEADSIHVLTEGQVYVRGQVSPVTPPGTGGGSLDLQYKELKASLVSKSGGGGWPELELELEKEPDHKARLGDALSATNLNSAVRRTEIVTGTYLIRRPDL